MKIRKIMAAMLAASMVLGNGIVGFADGVSGVAGQGVLTFIKDKTGVEQIILPSSLNSGGALDFTIDPEGLVAKSKQMYTADSDGNAFAATRLGSSDGVYFVNSGGTFKSTSDEVKLIVQAPEDKDVFVTVTPSGGTNTIELVDSSGALDSSGVAKLYLEVKLGSGGTAKAISSSGGTTVSTTVTGKPDNYVTQAKSGGTIGEYEIAFSSGTTGSAGESKWNYAALTLSGKSQGVVSEGMKAPDLQFTWKIVKHYTEKTGYGSWSGSDIWLAQDSKTVYPSTAIVQISSDGKEYDDMAEGKYTVSDSGWISVSWNNMVGSFKTEPETIYIGVVVGNNRYVVKAKG